MQDHAQIIYLICAMRLTDAIAIWPEKVATLVKIEVFYFFLLPK